MRASSSGPKPAAESLPGQVERLAIANGTLMNSLKQAHSDLAALLIDRDELSESLRGAEEGMGEAIDVASTWMRADLEGTRQRVTALRQNIAEVQRTRSRVYDLLKTLDADTAVAQ